MRKFPGAQPKKAKFGHPTRLPEQPNNDRLPPIFSFEFMPDKSGYSVNCCNDEHRAALTRHLYQLSKLSWIDIKNAPRHGMGTERISRNSLKAPVPSKVTEDAEFLALRYHGKSPMVGYRDGRVFHVIWLDHNFSLYPH